MMSAPAAVDRPHFSLGVLLTTLLFRCVSKHAKRLFYIASLCDQFDHYSQRRTLAITKLNQAIRMAHRPEAMTNMPAAVTHRVWQDTGLESILTEQRLVDASTDDSLRALARQVVEISRKWWYGDVNEMTNDVSFALKTRRAHLMDQAFA